MGKKKSKRHYSSSSSSSEEDLVRRLKRLVRKKKSKERKSRRRHRLREPSSGRSSVDRTDGSRPQRKRIRIATSSSSDREETPSRRMTTRGLRAPSREKSESTDSSNDTATEKNLSVDVLNVIGQRLEEEKKFGPPVHSSFAVRWTEILKLGLPLEEKDALIKKYPRPDNCAFLEPPKINAEVELAMNETARTRDKRIINKQDKLVACLAGISKTISSLLEREKAEDLPFIESLSDVCRLIADAMHDETAIRRSLILANVNASMKETLKKTAAEDYLFGNKLTDNLKAAKLVEQSAEDLKISKSSTAHNSKNYKAPAFQSNKKSQSGGSGGQKPTSSAAQNRNSRSQKPDYHQKSQSNGYRNSQRKPYYKRRY